MQIANHWENCFWGKGRAQVSLVLAQTIAYWSKASGIFPWSSFCADKKIVYWFPIPFCVILRHKIEDKGSETHGK